MKKLVLLLSLNFLFSCHLTESDPADQTAKSFKELSIVEKEVIAGKIKNNDKFKLFMKSVDQLNDALLSRRLVPLTKDKSIMSKLDKELKLAGSDKAAEEILGKMFNNPKMIVDFYDSMRSNLNTADMKKSISQLKYLSDVEIASLYSDATKLEFKERQAKAKKAVDCAGQCSEALNIDMSWALTNLYYASGVCGLLSPTIIGALGCAGASIGAYLIYINEYALPNFESCWGAC